MTSHSMATKFASISGGRLPSRTDSIVSRPGSHDSKASLLDDRDSPHDSAHSSPPVRLKSQEPPSSLTNLGAVSKIAAGMARGSKGRESNDRPGSAAKFFKSPTVKKGRTREPLSEDAQSMISSNFKVFDKDGSNTISFSELQSAFKAVLGYDATPEEMEDILQRLNNTGSKEIGMQAFEKEMTARFQERLGNAEAENVFNVLNGEASNEEEIKSDFLSLDNLRSSLQSLGLYSRSGGDGRISEEELYLMYAHADLDGDGLTSRQDFFACLSLPRASHLSPMSMSGSRVMMMMMIRTKAKMIVIEGSNWTSVGPSSTIR